MKKIIKNKEILLDVRRRGGFMDGDESLFCGLVFVVGFFFVLPVGSYLLFKYINDDMEKKGYRYCHEIDGYIKDINYDILSVDNGEVVRIKNLTKTVSDAEIHKSKYDANIEVIDQDIDNLVVNVYVYDNEKIDLETYTDFVESCIAIDDNNHVYFNIDYINEENYKLYLNSTSNKENEISYTRKRNN